MKLHSPSFSRASRRLLRAERRASPELRRAMRRARRRGSESVPAWVWRSLWSVVPASVLLSLDKDAGAAASAFVSLWFLEVCLLGRGVVRSQASSVPPALLPLPFAPAEYQRMARRRVLALLWRPCLDALLLLAVLNAMWSASTMGWCLVIPLAALCGVSVWSATLWLARVPIPGMVTTVVLLVPVGLAIGLLTQAGWLRDWLPCFLAAQSDWLTLLSPGGWIAAAFLGVLGERSALWLLAVLLAAIPVLRCRTALRDLVREIDPENALLAEWSTASARSGAQDGEEEEEELTVRRPLRPLTEATAATALREEWPATGFLGSRPAGWIESTFLRWLGARERVVLECTATRMPGWTRTTVWAARFLLVSVLASWGFDLVPRFVPGSRGILAALVALAAFVGLASGLPFASGFDRLSSRTSAYGISLAQPALYPLGLTELVRLTVKAAAVRTVVMLPLVAGAAAVAATPLAFRPLMLALVGTKLVLLALAASPMLCVMAISSVSSDSRTPGWRGVKVVGLLLVGVLALLALAVAVFCAGQGRSWGLLLAFAALSWTVAALYVRLYNRGGFDLVQRQRFQITESSG
jgi:hypothetical protein